MIDVAVASPAYLDLTFAGLPEIPRPGQERFAADLLRSPGGGAITAIGLARLGLDAALASPLGDDDAGAFVRAALELEGVRTVAPHPGRTPTTVVMPAQGDRAMVTYDPRTPARADDLRVLAPRGVVCGLEQLELVPAEAWTYATCGNDGAEAFADRLPVALGAARALLVNAPEAALLTGRESPVEAARALAARVTTAIVTLGRDGAVGVVDGELLRVPGVDLGPPADTTGAGDLFAAAFVWADLHGVGTEDRLRWATLYAALSVTSLTGARGAVTEPRLIEEGARRGLRPPAVTAGQALPASSPKER